jgi:hypothetical protein
MRPRETWRLGEVSRGLTPLEGETSETTHAGTVEYFDHQQQRGDE